MKLLKGAGQLRTMAVVLLVVCAIIDACAGAIPENDNFATRIPLFGTSVTTTGNNAGATFESGEPVPSFDGGKSVWWTWTAPADGGLTLTTAGSSFNTIVTLFTGNDFSNLALVAFNDEDPLGTTNVSRIDVNVVAGTAYQIAVDGSLNATGSISLQLVLGPAAAPPSNDNFANRIVLSGTHLSNITADNSGATREPNEPYHVDELGGKSVWWTWTAPADGGVTLTTANSVIDTLLAVYTGNSLPNLILVAGNDEDPLSTAGLESRVTFNAISGVTYQIAVDGYDGDEGFIRLRLDQDGAFAVPANDNFANRITLTGSSITTTGSNVGATFEVSEPSHLFTFGGKSVWWTWTAPASGGVTLDTGGSAVDTILCVYKGNSLAGLTFVAGNDEDFVTLVEGDSKARFNVTAGTTYQIAVDGFDGESGTIIVHLLLGAADAVPANDNFANRIALTGSAVSTSGSNVGATLETGEPLHDDSYGGKSIWWRWTSPGVGFVTIDTIGSLCDTLLAVYTGGTVSSLTEVASDDESGGNYTSRVNFITKSNVTYQIAVDGFDGDSGAIALHINFTQASYSLTVTTNPPGAGTVSINPLPDQGLKYAPGSVVTLTATPGSRSVFTGWTGGVTSTNNPVVIAMTSNKTVVAGFFVIPITHEWTGSSAAGGNWTDADNWSGGTPLSGDFLVFPPGASQRDSNMNDFPTNSVFGSFTFGGSDYVLAGNPALLNGGITCTNANGTNLLNLNLQLNADQSFRCGNVTAGVEVAGKVDLANRTLTAAGTGNIILSGPITGTGGIVKTNTGALWLTGNNTNTYTGPTIVNQGTLQLGKTGVAIAGPLVIGDGIGGANSDVVHFTTNSQLASSSAVTISGSGLLDLDGFTGAIGSLAMTGGNATTGTGSLGLNGGITVSAASSQATISGNLSLQGATRTFNVADGSASVDLLISAAIGNGAGTGGILKTGPGTLQLTASNSYSGLTTINDGILAVLNDFGLGTAAQGTVVNNNASLSLTGVNVNGEPLTLLGGTLASGAGNSSWTGNIQLTNTSSISVAASSGLNLSGVVSGAGGFTKTGDGTLTISGNANNTYAGATTVSRGTLLLSKPSGSSVVGPLVIGDGSGGVNADVVRFTKNSQLGASSAVTVNSSGLLDLDGFTGVAGSLSMTSGNVTTGTGSLGLNGSLTANAASASATITGNLLLQGANRTFNIADGSAAIDLLISAAIGNGSGVGGIIKAGSGTLQLTASNSYSGLTTINEGIVTLVNPSGFGTTNLGTLVASNALLSVNGVTVNGEPLALTGGTLALDASSNSWTGPIALTNTSLITVATNGTLNLPGVISGPGAVTKSGDGTLVFSGNSTNAFSGATTVTQGTLLLSKTSSNAVPAALIIGDGFGGVNADVVRLTGNAQVAASSAVTVNSSGRFDLNGFTNVIGSLTMTSGNVTSGAGSLGLNGNVTVNAASASANITGNLSLQGANRTFNVADGSAAIDVLISAAIGNGSGVGGIIKAGSGTLNLNASNTYSGTTTINEGVLAILNSAALGTTNLGTVVNSNAVLSLNGLGVSGEGLALVSGSVASDAGSNFWTGSVTLTNTSTFTIATNVTLNLAGVISGPGNVSKNGDGLLIFSGSSNNTYSGVTTVNQGTLLLSKTTSNAVPGALVIGDGIGIADADRVRLDSVQQISIASDVTVNGSGLLSLNNASDSIASLSGNGHIDLGGAGVVLSVGHDNTPTIFDGILSGAGGLTKAGAGALTLTGANTYTGLTSVNEGQLFVNGFQPGSSVQVNPPALLGGTGRIGALSGSGTVSPGLSPGVLSSSHVTFSSNTIYRVELNGPNPGSGYDQLNVSGAVALAGTLNATLGFTLGTNESFTIINNDGVDPILGVFNGLPEGKFFFIGGALFQITYAGGPGSNDVILTHVLPPASTINSFVMTNGTGRLQGSGQTGLDYIIEAAPTLTPPIPWTPISTNTANASGAYQFTDTNALSLPRRFFRIRSVP